MVGTGKHGKTRRKGPMALGSRPRMPWRSLFSPGHGRRPPPPTWFGDRNHRAGSLVVLAPPCPMERKNRSPRIGPVVNHKFQHQLLCNEILAGISTRSSTTPGRASNKSCFDSGMPFKKEGSLVEMDDSFNVSTPGCSNPYGGWSNISRAVFSGRLAPRRL